MYNRNVKNRVRRDALTWILTLCEARRQTNLILQYGRHITQWILETDFNTWTLKRDFKVLSRLCFIVTINFSFTLTLSSFCFNFMWEQYTYKSEGLKYRISLLANSNGTKMTQQVVKFFPFFLKSWKWNS